MKSRREWRVAPSSVPRRALTGAARALPARASAAQGGATCSKNQASMREAVPKSDSPDAREICEQGDRPLVASANRQKPFFDQPPRQDQVARRVEVAGQRARRGRLPLQQE